MTATVSFKPKELEGPLSEDTIAKFKDVAKTLNSMGRGAIGRGAAVSRKSGEVLYFTGPCFAGMEHTILRASVIKDDLPPLVFVWAGGHAIHPDITMKTVHKQQFRGEWNIDGSNKTSRAWHSFLCHPKDSVFKNLHSNMLTPTADSVQEIGGFLFEKSTLLPPKLFWTFAIATRGVHEFPRVAILYRFLRGAKIPRRMAALIASSFLPTTEDFINGPWKKQVVNHSHMVYPVMQYAGRWLSAQPIKEKTGYELGGTWQSETCFRSGAVPRDDDTFKVKGEGYPSLARVVKYFEEVAKTQLPEIEKDKK